MINRNNATEIPGLEELRQVYTTGSPRMYERSALGSSYELTKFTSFTSLLDFFGIEYIPYLSKTITLKEYLQWSREIIHDLTTRIVQGYSNPEMHKRLDRVYEYLSQSDTLVSDSKPVDIGLVFGSSSHFRIQKAIDMYKLNIIRNIMVSGKGPIYKESKRSEAEALAQYALGHGIPPKDIIIEEKSNSIPDNVKRSFDFIEDNQISITSIAIITSPFAVRRSYVNILKFLDTTNIPSLDIYRISSACSNQFSKDQWYTQDMSCKIVLNEFVKMFGEWLVDRDILNENFYSP